MKKRLFIAGEFSGGRNIAKRELFIDRGLYCDFFDEVIFLSGSQKLYSSHLPDDFYPALCSQVPFQIHSFLFGSLEFLVMLVRNTRFCLEIVTLENAFFPDYCDRKFSTRILKKISCFSRLVCGLAHLKKILRRFRFGASDTVIVWTEHLPSRRLLKYYVNLSSARLLFSEYGEVPGTCFICADGMFHESWPAHSIANFSTLPICQIEVQRSKHLLHTLLNHRVSNKSQQYTQKMIESQFFAGSDTVIYINGSEPGASGLFPRCSDFSKKFSPHFDSNVAVLKFFEKLAQYHGWKILYKDHPNTYKSHPKLLVPKCGWSSCVKVLGDVDIYDVLQRSDLMVSLGSKSIYLSLLSGVPVMLLGPYSISPELLSSGCYLFDGEESVVRSVNAAANCGVDFDGLNNHVTRLLKYYLYSVADDRESIFGRGRQQFWSNVNEYVERKRDVVSCASDVWC